MKNLLVVLYLKVPLLLSIMLLSFPVKIIYAQDISLGGSIIVKAPGTNLTFGLGLNFSGEYRFTENYSGRLNLKYVISSFQNNKYFGDDSYIQRSYEADFLYHPFKGSTQLYAGLGIGYFVPNINNSGMPNRFSGSNSGNPQGLPISLYVRSNQVNILLTATGSRKI